MSGSPQDPEHKAWERVVAFLPEPTSDLLRVAFTDALEEYRTAVVDGQRRKLAARVARIGAWADSKYDKSGRDHEEGVWREGVNDALGMILTRELAKVGHGEGEFDQLG